MAKSAALIKNETLAQVGNRIENLPRMIAFAKSAIANGIPANESQGTPALTAEEVCSVLNPSTISIVDAWLL